MERDIDRYEAEYVADYGFERVMVEYRQRLQLARIDELQPKVVVEVGCGADLLYRRYLDHRAPVECWVIVEPAESFCSAAAAETWPEVHVVIGTFERRRQDVSALLPRDPDLVLCSSLLHEVPDPRSLLSELTGIMGAPTRLHVNVPNAASLHRRLAVAMSLSRDVHELSGRNKRLMQSRVYDAASLDSELRSAGLDVVKTGGCLVKPFTHAQMEAIMDTLGPGVLDGLYRLGVDMPDIASEIYAEAVLAAGQADVDRRR